MSIRAVGGDTTILFDDYGNETGKNKLIIQLFFEKNGFLYIQVESSTFSTTVSLTMESTASLNSMLDLFLCYYDIKELSRINFLYTFY